MSQLIEKAIANINKIKQKLLIFYKRYNVSQTSKLEKIIKEDFDFYMQNYGNKIEMAYSLNKNKFIQSDTNYIELLDLGDSEILYNEAERMYESVEVINPIISNPNIH